MEVFDKKLAYLCEFFKKIDDYQKPVDNLKKEEFFCRLKNKCPDDSEIERTKEIIKKIFFKDGEELTQSFLKSDVFLLACVFEKTIKVSVHDFGNNPLNCVSLPGYIWEFGLKYTGINIQTLQDKDLIITSENNIRAGISSVMGDRYVKSDENKKLLSKDGTTLLEHSMCRSLPYDGIEMWHGHSDCYMNKLEEILNSPNDSDIGYFVEVDLKYPENIKKTKKFPFCTENKGILKDEYNNYMKKIKPKN